MDISVRLKYGADGESSNHPKNRAFFVDVLACKKCVGCFPLLKGYLGKPIAVPKQFPRESSAARPFSVQTLGVIDSLRPSHRRVHG
jgi:hypothetical protein